MCTTTKVTPRAQPKGVQDAWKKGLKKPALAKGLGLKIQIKGSSSSGGKASSSGGGSSATAPPVNVAEP